MRILAIRNDRFGEFLLNIPAFKALKQSFKDSTLTLMVDDSVVELAKTINCVDDVISFKSKKHSFFDLIKIAKKLRNKFDCCIIFNPSKASHVLSFLSGAPKRIGYSRKWDFLLTKSIKDEKDLGLKHEVEHNLDLVSLLEIKADDKEISLDIKPELAKNLFQKYDIKEGERFVVLHPFTSDERKRWPLNYFQQLAINIVKKYNLKVFIVGEASQRSKTEYRFSGVGRNIFNIIGETSLVELAAFLSKSACLVSCDSGPVHLAAAVSTPTIALFRNDLPGKTAKRWGPWGQGHIVIEKKNLILINIVEVMQKLDSILGL